MARDIPSWKQLHARAVVLAQQAGGPHGVTLGSLKLAVEADPAPPLDAALLEECRAHLDEFDVLPRLVLCMQFLRWLSDTPSMIVEVYLFARSATEATHALGRQGLLPLRLSLIDGLLALDPDPEEQADLRFRRGNTLLTLAHNTPELYDAALQDLRAAVELGRASGHALAEINAECVLARAEFLTTRPGRSVSPEALSERVARLEALLPRADPLDMADRVHDIVGDLEVKRFNQGHPEALPRAIHHGRRAADLAREPWVKSFRLASLAELLLLHGTPEDKDRAIPLAREAVATLPPDAGDLHAVPAHAALGYVLLCHGQAAEAMEHLQFALELLARQEPSPNRNLIRLRLAKSLLEQERLDDARHHVELALADARDIGDQSALSEATRYLVLLDRQGGQDDRARQRLVEAEAELAGTADQTALTLERLRPRPGEPLSTELSEYFRRYLAGQLATDATSDQILEALVGRHVRQLPPDIRQEFLRRGERLIRAVVVRARLLASEKRDQEAIELLRGFLATEQEPDARLDAAILLLALLPVEGREELLRWCDEVEPLLEGHRDNIYSRSALADALWRCGREEPGLLERALRHAEVGAADPDADPDALVRNLRIRSRIRLDQVSLRALESSPEQQELASWFTRELPFPAEELSGCRCHVVRCLLATGPLTHPGTPALAERLLALVLPGDMVRALRSRLEWITACLASPRSPPAPPAGLPEEFQSAFDAVPGWAVALAQGEPPSVDSVPPGEVLSMALAVAEARPDRAEAVLEWLFTGHDVPHLLERLSDEVAQSLGTSSTGLLERVEKVAVSTPSFPLLRLRVTIHRKLAASGDMASYERAVDALLAFARAPEERVEAKIIKGIERMDADVYEAARRILDEAREEARGLGWNGGKLFSLLVTSGNAWSKGKALDLQKALALYTEAETVGSNSSHESARLWKVKADALLDRGGEGDATAALVLLERSLTVRETGFLRAEALLSAARAEHVLPGRDEAINLRRALDRLDEAARHADGSLQLLVADRQLKVLARLVRRQPGHRALTQRIEELGRRHPELADEARRAIQGVPGLVPDDVMDAAESILRHPAGRAYMKATFRLGTPDLSMSEKLARDNGEDLAKVRQRLEQEFQAEDRSPQAIRAYADRLAHTDEDPQALAGVAVGRARLLAHVAEHGLAQREEVERVTQEAEQLVRRMPEPQVRRILLLELSHVWAPENHYNHPIRDFRRAAEFAREVMESCPPGESTFRSALQSLARATRYRTDGDISAHLREAEQLYERCAREYEAAGESDVAAHVRINLAELRVERRSGNHLEDLQTGIDAARARLKEGGSPQQQAKARLNLAISLTMLGSGLSSPRGDSLLREAREHFGNIDRARLPETSLHNLDNYRTICLAELAERAGNHEEAVYLWRQRLASLGPTVPEEVWAYTAHNLADILLRFRSGSTLVQLLEGLDLSEKLLHIRSLERNPVHHWETCENIGRAVAVLLLSTSGGTALSPTFSRELWERGRKALRGALAAARRIGSHERLMQSAEALLELSRSAPTLSGLEDAASEGWDALDEARPYLLLDERAGFMEARLGVEVATILADRLADGGLVGMAEGLGFVLSGERAEFVLRWMVRAAGAAQRRLAGRTARPAGASHATWVEWLAAIRSGEGKRIERVLDDLRRDAPTFLRGEPVLEGTWNWLRSRPGAATVAVMGGSQGLLAAILTHDGQNRVLVARLEAGRPPCDESTVARGLTADGPTEEYRSVLEWARRHIVGPLEGLLPQNPSRLLWVPTGALRVLAPADLWPSVPVTCAVRLDLETRPPPARPRRTLLAVADPGPGTPLSIPSSIEMGALLARMAQDLGPLRVRMSRGAACGQSLGIPCPELVDGPASPEDILRELAEVDLAMLLCHGEVEGPRQARLLLVDGTGTLVPLGMERLAEDPRRVAGTTVVLLSCQTGRVGDWIHQAAGLAGALLAGGARSVIAPLWPVLLEPALAVGNAVLRTLASREDMSAVLWRLTASESGPALGGPARVRHEQETAWSLRAFVRWMG